MRLAEQIHVFEGHYEARVSTISPRLRRLIPHLLLGWGPSRLGEVVENTCLATAGQACSIEECEAKFFEQLLGEQA